MRYFLHGCWVSEYTALPELDANGNQIALETLKVELEGWERDPSTLEPDRVRTRCRRPRSADVRRARRSACGRRGGGGAVRHRLRCARGGSAASLDRPRRRLRRAAADRGDALARARARAATPRRRGGERAGPAADRRRSLPRSASSSARSIEARVACACGEPRGRGDRGGRAGAAFERERSGERAAIDVGGVRVRIPTGRDQLRWIAAGRTAGDGVARRVIGARSSRTARMRGGQARRRADRRDRARARRGGSGWSTFASRRRAARRAARALAADVDLGGIALLYGWRAETSAR